MECDLPACGDDDVFVAVVRGEMIPWRGVRSEGVLKAILRPRHHTGRFASPDGDVTTKVDGIIVTHSGAIHPGIRALAPPLRKPKEDTRFFD